MYVVFNSLNTIMDIILTMETFFRDVDETAMDILIDFCYTSNIVVEESNVQTLLPAACLLQLAEIQVC